MSATIDIIQTRMVGQDHQAVNYMLYREDASIIVKLFEMIQLFVQVNGQLHR